MIKLVQSWVNCQSDKCFWPKDVEQSEQNVLPDSFRRPPSGANLWEPWRRHWPEKTGSNRFRNQFHTLKMNIAWQCMRPKNFPLALALQQHSNRYEFESGQISVKQTYNADSITYKWKKFDPTGKDTHYPLLLLVHFFETQIRKYTSVEWQIEY